VPNEFLQSLTKSDLALVRPHLTSVALKHGDLLAQTGQPIDKVYFPVTGLISMVVELSTGEQLEAALIGRMGVFGGAVALGGSLHLSTAIVQMPGSFQVLKAADLLEAGSKSASLRIALFREEQFVFAQAQHTAACNAKHQIAARLSTWLMRVRDASHAEELLLTQEFLAQMLGVQRASVSMVASSLQESGAISYRRGKIRITDLPRLKSIACECYDALRVQHARLFPERDQSAPASTPMAGRHGPGTPPEATL
jgi:CRP-like cAMP-binding protein